MFVYFYVSGVRTFELRLREYVCNDTILYKPVDDDGLHHMFWLSVWLGGHVSLGQGEVRGRDGDGVTTEIIVLGGWRIHGLALVGQQRTQHHAQCRRTDCCGHQQLLGTEHCQHREATLLACSPTVQMYTRGLIPILCCGGVMC